MLEVIPIGGGEEATADVVLLHGLGGDWRRTWAQRRVSSSWPEWLAEDTSHLSVWCIRYGASPTRWRGESMPISDRAKSLLAALKVHDLGSRPLVLVGHSLGGLLIKQMVRHCVTMSDQYEHLMDQLRGVVFFSTPHNGSGLVSVARFLRQARITPLTEELGKNRAYLRDLDDWYRNRVTKTKLNHLSFFETKNTYWFRVVGEDSGDPQLPGMSAIPVDANHRTICKFSNRDAITYQQVRKFVETCTTFSLPSTAQRAHATIPLRASSGVERIGIAHTSNGDIVIQVGDAILPTETLRSLASHIPGAPPSVRQTLPRDIHAFTGREEVLRGLLEAVEQGAQAGTPVLIHAIDGMAGVGKTALAIHAAHQLAASFPDGQLFVRLDAHTPGRPPVDPGDALTALLRETGLDPREIPVELDEKERLWRDRLAGQHILLVLDDAADHQQVQPLLPGVGGCAVVVTSRRRLAALDGATAIPLDVLPAWEAARLFGRLSGRTEVETEATAELVRLAGYLPLAIRLLAGRLRYKNSWAVADLAKDLAAARDRSTAIGAADGPISAVFDLSYNRLPEDRRKFFRQLGLHPGSDIDAYAVAALSGLDLDHARGELEALFTDHLIDEPIFGRYRFHDLLADYARALAGTDLPADRGAAIDRLLGYYLHTAEAADHHLTQRVATGPAASMISAPPVCLPQLATSDQALGWMEGERSNLHAAVDHAVLHHRPGHAIAIAAAMASFLRGRGHWTQALTLHRTALATARNGDDRLGEAGALNDLGTVQRLAGDYPAATASQERALELYRALGSQLGQANSLHELGRLQYMTGNFAAAAVHCKRALEMYRSLDTRLGQATARNDLGRVQYTTGDCAAATASHEWALELFRVLGSQLGQANALYNLGVVHRRTGDYGAATASHEQALELYRALGDRRGQANALNNLGIVQRLTGNYAAATASHEQALELYRALGDRLGQANAPNNLGVVQRLTGDYAAATASHEQALDLHRALGDRRGQANALYNLGAVQRLTGNFATATASHEQALELYRALAYGEGVAEVLNGLGELSLATSNVIQAQDRHEEALTIARDLTAPEEEARALEGIGRCHIHDGLPDEARDPLQHALTLYQSLRSPNARPVETILQRLDRR